MTILYEPQPRDIQQVAVLLGGDVHPATTRPDLSRLLAERPAEQLVVLGPGVELREALAIAAEYRVSRPALGVVLIRALVDIALLGEALRAGVREVVPVDDRVSLLAACARSIEISRQMAPVSPVVPEQAGLQREAKVITVFAAKGGCGKTTIATNLAIALAADGARRVGLIDLDLAFGDVAIMLQLAPQRGIANASEFGAELDEQALRTIFTAYSPGVHALLAPPGPTEAEQVSQQLVAKVLGLAGGMFDYLVIDTPPQFNEHVLVALERSHLHVLLTTPDIPALKNLRITLDTFDLLRLPKEQRLVVLNRSDAKVGLTAADIERVIRVPISAHVPSSRDVPVSINKGIPIVADNPSHPVSKAVRDFATGQLGDTEASKPTSPGLRGLFGRGGKR
ncbi:AAA family ATPase [Micromonospora sp. SL1-18]|uniref:AAA family ATPase n=1 Tax=Micromonospora sp. SL1-18 TaxID=3399128 RepID=UPI003A4E5D58